MFRLRDKVRIKNGGAEVYTVEEIRDVANGRQFWIQRGADFAARVWKREDEIEAYAEKKIGFESAQPRDRFQIADHWEKKFGDIKVKYSTQGVVDEGYVHDCECQHGDTKSATSVQTQGTQLNREQIERLPHFVKFLSQYIS